MSAAEIEEVVAKVIAYVQDLETIAEEQSEEIVKLSDTVARQSAELERWRPITMIKPVINDLPF